MIKIIQKIQYLLLLFFISTVVFSQPITQYEQFNGRYDFTALGNTLNEAENAGGYCDILTSSSADLNLLPGQTVVAAYLYWAGSGDGDFEVELNGVEINAERTFIEFDGSVTYFGAFADVTTLVQSTGNGNYTLSELDLTAVIGDYCQGATGSPGNGTNFGGWSITIVFEDLALPNNQLTIYDGLQKVFSPDPILNIDLLNLNVVDVIGAKVGFLVWEGDAGLANGETLSINGVVMEDLPLNPATNAFNSTNSYTGASDLWNMDLDLYSIEDVINVGDTSMLVQLNTDQDGIIVNNINVVLASELPDATIDVTNVEVYCDSRDIDIDFTVFNQESTDILPANTPISFYADGTLVGNSATINDIPANGSESNTISLTIPVAIPNDFTLTAVADDVGDGTGVVAEIDETNNSFEVEVTLIENPVAGPVDTIIVCDLDDDGFANFFLLVAEPQLLGTQTDIDVTFHETLDDAENGANQILTPESYTNIDSPIQTIFVRLENSINGCFITSSFLIEVRPVDYIPFELVDLEFCIDGNNDVGYPIDLTVQEDFIFAGVDPSDYTVTYHLSQLEAAAGDNPFPNPTAYPNIENPQLLWVRIVNNVINCVEIGSFTVLIKLNPPVTLPADMTPYELCDDETADGFTEFDLSTKIGEITGNNPFVSVSFHESQLDAEDNINPLPVFSYINTSNPQTIYVRVRDINNGCVVYTNFDLIVNENPAITTPEPITFCDSDNDGFGEFDLDSVIPEISGGDPSISVSFHETITNAQNNVLPLSSPYNNIVQYVQTVYARASNLKTGCSSLIALELQVLDSPQIEDPSPLVQCDYNSNGTSTFDLTL
ncbi:CARDB domain-containing protein, partial [Planktosalinus lacus]|uniref:CARDB domain-containing protein n=1 Tax=Planktosalinus lacus TaxID=1526573 RepID=UPI00166A84F9